MPNHKRKRRMVYLGLFVLLVPVNYLVAVNELHSVGGPADVFLLFSAVPMMAVLVMGQAGIFIGSILNVLLLILLAKLVVDCIRYILTE